VQKDALAPRTPLNRDVGRETRRLSALRRLLAVAAASHGETGESNGDHGGRCLYGWNETAALPLGEFQARKATDLADDR
jgi:hypothetical protein